MSLLRPDRSLLNAHFEGYKIDPIDERDVISRYPLEYRPSQRTISGRSPLSFKEVQSRIRHNHLAMNTYGQALYIDADLRAILVEFDAATLEPRFQAVYQLPQPIQTDSDVQREYPSAGHLSERRWLVADGQGSAYVFEISVNANAPTLVLQNFDLSTIQAVPSRSSAQPFRIHDALRVSPDHSIAILSSKSPAEPGPSSQRTSDPNSPSSTSFDIWAARVSLTDPDAQPVFLWHRRADDVPLCAYYDPSRAAFLITASSPLRSLIVQPVRPYELSSDELAPVPRAGENLDAQTTRPPPYSWTQTADSVTIMVPLPSQTAKSQLKVLFTPQTVTLHVDRVSDSLLPVRIPRYNAKRLWGSISPSASLWTWEREEGHSSGLLTLHLDKMNEGTRWPQVFASTEGDAGPESDAEDTAVPETLDPSELANIRETLEKYTTSIHDGTDLSGLGLGSGVPALAAGEIDDDVDLAVGNEVCLTWIGSDGSTPSWALSNADQIFTGLSTSLLGTAEDSVTMVTKSNLDGLLFTLSTANDPQSSPMWTHTFTYPALSFVLASKQDTRFVHHISDKAVLAFESGTRHGSGNVYIYKGAGNTEKWAKQAILRVGGGSAGSLLGVGGVVTPNNGTFVLCLCETELVLLRTVG